MVQKISLVAVSVAALLILAGCTHEQNTEMQSESTPMPVIQNQPAQTEMTDELQTGYIGVSVQEAKQLIDENPELIVIDVSPNYAQGHLPGAVNYYVGDGSLDRAIPNLDMNAMYLVYCHVDSAAILGAQKLVDAGFMNVYRLEGNYKAWVDAGYPVEK